jgi:hypothetical protein
MCSIKRFVAKGKPAMELKSTPGAAQIFALNRDRNDPQPGCMAIFISWQQKGRPFGRP